MSRLITTVIISLFLFALTSCQKDEVADQHSAEQNVVKDYIEVPKEKAAEAGKKVEDAQDEVQDQVDDLEVD